MASRRSGNSRQSPRSLPLRSERHTEAYLATREALRRIERSSALAYLTSNAVTMHWSGLGSSVGGKA